MSRLTLVAALAAGSALPGNDWITNGGNLFNQRYSPLTQINRDNVRDLEAQWRTHLDGSGAGPQYSGQGQPLFYQGVLYVVTGADDVFALDVASGAHLWTYEAKLDPAHMRQGIAEISKTGWVYLLDRATGKPLLGIPERPVPQEPRQHTAATQPYQRPLP